MWSIKLFFFANYVKFITGTRETGKLIKTKNIGWYTLTNFEISFFFNLNKIWKDKTIRSCM